MSKDDAAKGIYRVNGVLITGVLYAHLEAGLKAPLTAADVDASKRVNSREFASSYEGAVAAQLDEVGLVYEAQHRIGRRRYDFFVPSLNLLLEVDGEGHFGDVFDKCENTVYNDTVKAVDAINLGYGLLRIHHEYASRTLPDLSTLEGGTYYMFGGPSGAWTRHVDGAPGDLRIKVL
jgi:very-short-patch-repair endonuclease